MPITGSCLCGAVKFEIDFVPDTAVACNCSFCTKRGALWAYAKPDQFRLLTPIENARSWSRIDENQHYFCATCGCTMFGDTPDWSNWTEAGPSGRHFPVNIRVLDDFDIDAVTIEKLDGKSGW